MPYDKLKAEEKTLFINTVCNLLSLRPDLLGEASTFAELADGTDEFARELYDGLEGKRPRTSVWISKTNL